MTATSPKNVEADLIEALKSCGIDIALTLPCDKIKHLLGMIPGSFEEIPMTREEDGIGIAAGLYLAGKRPAMIIQSTGLGNSLNSLSSLHMTYDIPLPILASWRGVYKEGIVAQVHFGKALPGILDAAGIPHIVAESPADVPKISDAVKASYDRSSPYVVLLSPRIWDDSCPIPFIPNEIMRERRCTLNCTFAVPEPKYTRFDMIKGIVPYLKDKIVVSNIGIPSKELYAAIDQPSNFYMLGSLGLASSIGLGIAKGKPDREVVVLDGDGSILMNPNALSSISQAKPDNLTIIAFDNSAHGSTGNQRTFSSSMDLQQLARAYGIDNTAMAASPEDLIRALEIKETGPGFIHTIIRPKNADVPNIPLSPHEIKHRFMDAIR